MLVSRNLLIIIAFGLTGCFGGGSGDEDEQSSEVFLDEKGLASDVEPGLYALDGHYTEGEKEGDRFLLGEVLIDQDGALSFNQSGQPGFGEILIDESGGTEAAFELLKSGSDFSLVNESFINPFGFSIVPGSFQGEVTDGGDATKKVEGEIFIEGGPDSDDLMGEFSLEPFPGFPETRDTLRKLSDEETVRALSGTHTSTRQQTSESDINKSLTIDPKGNLSYADSTGCSGSGELSEQRYGGFGFDVSIDFEQCGATESVPEGFKDGNYDGNLAILAAFSGVESFSIVGMFTIYKDDYTFSIAVDSDN